MNKKIFSRINVKYFILAIIILLSIIIFKPEKFTTRKTINNDYKSFKCSCVGITNWWSKKDWSKNCYGFTYNCEEFYPFGIIFD